MLLSGQDEALQSDPPKGAAESQSNQTAGPIPERPREGPEERGIFLRFFTYDHNHNHKPNNRMDRKLIKLKGPCSRRRSWCWGR